LQSSIIFFLTLNIVEFIFIVQYFSGKKEFVKLSGEIQSEVKLILGLDVNNIWTTIIRASKYNLQINQQD
jgi:hypothetical protein